jgi:DNA-binding HxlR family transcriptional regulator
MAAPKPGTKVRSSKTGRPIMAALDLLGRRWALRILWELRQNGASSFRDLQRLCGDISPTVLNTRLSELRATGIIAQRDKEGYVITEEGIALGKIILMLNAWAERWAGRMKVDEAPRPGIVKASPVRKKS